MGCRLRSTLELEQSDKTTTEELACIWHPPGAAAVGAILVEPPAIREGWLELPERPGLGVRLAQDLPERYPFVEGHYAVEIER